jgi:hypothetical protein
VQIIPGNRLFLRQAAGANKFAPAQNPIVILNLFNSSDIGERNSKNQFPPPLFQISLCKRCIKNLF